MSEAIKETYIFDVGAGVNGDNITVLDTQIVAHNTVQAAAAVIKIIVTKHDQNCVLSLLAADKYGITSEQLEGVHGVIGQSNNGVVIVDGIGDPVAFVSLSLQCGRRGVWEAYMSWLGFFFFLRMAVAVSSSSLCSLPEASLWNISVSSVCSVCSGVGNHEVTAG